MGTTIEDLVEITSMSDLDLLHARVVDGNQDNKITLVNFMKLLPITVSTSDPSGGSDGDFWFVREA